MLFNKDRGADLNDFRQRAADEGYPRNFSSVWQKFPQYNEENTVMVSNFFNQIEDFQRNDLTLPLFHPVEGKTDFLDDKHLVWTHSYLNFMAGLEP